MAKYSFEFKLKVVQEFLNSHGSMRSIGRKYGVHHADVQKWVNNYKRFGEDSLRRNRQNQVYTTEFKLHVIELYLSSELSYQQLAMQMGIPNHAIIARWMNEYRAAGPEALMPKKKGRKQTMDTEKIIQEINGGDSDEQKELLKQLQEENLKLRIENAFLKEVRRMHEMKLVIAEKPSIAQSLARVIGAIKRLYSLFLLGVFIKREDRNA